jgi:hypothetical protein
MRIRTSIICALHKAVHIVVKAFMVHNHRCDGQDKPKPIWLRRPEDVDTNLKRLTAAYTTRRRAFVNMAEVCLEPHPPG